MFESDDGGTLALSIAGKQSQDMSVSRVGDKSKRKKGGGAGGARRSAVNDAMPDVQLPGRINGCAKMTSPQRKTTKKTTDNPPAADIFEVLPPLPEGTALAGHRCGMSAKVFGLPLDVGASPG